MSREKLSNVSKETDLTQEKNESTLQQNVSEIENVTIIRRGRIQIVE